VEPQQRGCRQQAHSGGLQDGAVMLSGEEREVHPQPRCWRCYQIWMGLHLGSISCLLAYGRLLSASVCCLALLVHACRWLIFAAAAGGGRVVTPVVLYSSLRILACELYSEACSRLGGRLTQPLYMPGLLRASAAHMSEHSLGIGCTWYPCVFVLLPALALGAFLGATQLCMLCCLLTWLQCGQFCCRE
jgi:hypothetical protein